MKRQQIRKALILVSLLAFPLIFVYFSPVHVVRGAFNGVLVGSGLFFIILLLSALFLGRGFCGWVCPGAGFAEYCLPITNKSAAGGRYNWIKYVIWIPWIALLATAFYKAGGIKNINPFWQMEMGLSVTKPYHYIIYYSVVLLIIVPALLAGRRGFCHYICWMAPFMVVGDKLGRLLKLPSLRLTANSEECIGCSSCSKHCPMSLDVESMVESGDMAHSECSLCGQCADICPQEVIVFTFASGLKQTGKSK
jgi:ferredoxin-type protein NapH